MKGGFITRIKTPARSRRSGNTSTLLRPGSSALNVGWKVMATIFWDCKGVLLVDYLPQKTTMTGPYYGEVLTNLRHAVKEKRREILTRGLLLLHGNAPALMSRVAQAIVNDIGFEQLSHPPYSPNLTPSDFCLFQHQKQHLHGTRFFDDDELWQPMESYLDNMPQEFYLAGIKELFDKCEKCIDIRGDYIKNNVLFCQCHLYIILNCKTFLSPLVTNTCLNRNLLCYSICSNFVRKNEFLKFDQEQR